MKTFLKMFLAVLAAQILLIVVVVGLIASELDEKVKVSDGSVLIQVLDGEIPEAPAPGGLPIPGASEAPSHTAILENLEKARHDDRIKAVVLKIGMPGIGFAKQDELRERIAQLRDAGKPVWAYAEWLERTALYVGGACDSLFFLPTGYVSLRGVAAGRPFLRGTLEKLDIEQNIHRIGAYKSAAEMVQREEMSPESRANLEWILDEVYPHILETVERERRLDPGTMERIFAKGAITCHDALAAGLVDRLAYWDEIEQALLRLPGVKQDDKADKKYGARPRAVWGDDYASLDRKDAGIKGKKTIAVVHAGGLIQGEESGYSFPFGTTMGAGTMAQAFRDAAENKDVAAIVYRVDSGGGESSTSWKIQHAARRAAELKPMVVSMCDVAGSGGYLICYPFEPIVANPMSIVGSIGSISGKLNLREFYRKLGITWDFVTRGPNALMESEVTNYTPEQWEAFKSTHWRDYYEWVEDIAREREMTVAEVDSIGRGRVFTGKQALALRLIDQVGSFDDAVRLAKQKAGIPEGEEVRFVHYPKEKGLLETLRGGGLVATVQRLIHEIFRPWRETRGAWAVDWNQYR
jgi:protease-4